MVEMRYDQFATFTYTISESACALDFVILCWLGLGSTSCTAYMLYCCSSPRLCASLEGGDVGLVNGGEGAFLDCESKMVVVAT